MPGKSRLRQQAEREIREAVSVAVGIATGRYLKAYDRRAHGYALIGHTNEEIAELLHIDRDTFASWLQKHPSLARAIQSAREDAEVAVVRAMHRAAKGYKAKERRVRMSAEGQVTEIVEQIRFSAPSVAAAQFLLTNRAGDRWKDRKAVEHAGSVSLVALLDGLESRPAIEAPTIDLAPEE